MEDEIEEEAAKLPPTRVGYIKKRALKNKALSVSFNEKDLRDYVTGFHKRKKKRRKEAQKKKEEALRCKRIEARKKVSDAVPPVEFEVKFGLFEVKIFTQRKLERELALNGGAPPATDKASVEGDGYDEDDEESEPIASINGTTMYDNGEMQVAVTTSEISREDDPHGKTQSAVRRSVGADKKQNLAVSKKKSFKKVSKQKSRPKPQNKRDMKKGKKKKKKQ